MLRGFEMELRPALIILALAVMGLGSFWMAVRGVGFW